MSYDGFALGFIVGIVCTLTLLAATVRRRTEGYQPTAYAAPGSLPSGPAGVSRRP